MQRHLIILFILVTCLQSVSSQIIYINQAGKSKPYDSSFFKSSQLPDIKLTSIPVKNIRLLPGLFSQRYALNKKYMMSLENDKLLQNFYYEAGISKTGNIMVNKDLNLNDFYWGWESPTNQLRGHFLGHWLSAAAYMIAETGDQEVKARAEKIVAELAECQRINGGEWAGSIPEKYFDLMAQGQQIWSPQYTIHKTLMGLWDMYALTGSEQALDVLEHFADWFYHWTGVQLEGHNQAAIYGGETSGMLEIWANLYGLKHQQKYLALMERYGNPGMFQSLLLGEDALSNDHANASIPWSHGAARIYEVTGNNHWKDICLAFWKNAVLDRGNYCTGGQNSGEFWIPPHQLEKFASQNNQEHCTVYNMIRTADYLYRWTGDAAYADYIERNIYNGILAQQNPNTGMVAYFLPMAAGFTKGGEKGWGSPTMDFWCCHGTLVQAQVRYPEYLYFENREGLVISQYIPSELKWQRNQTQITIRQTQEAQDYDRNSMGSRWRMKFKIQTSGPVSFDLQFRIPRWVASPVVLKINGIAEKVQIRDGYLHLQKVWSNEEIYLEFPTCIYAVPLPDSENKYAFMEGPVVLAGITDHEICLKGDIHHPETIFSREYEHEYKVFPWKQSHYLTIRQQENLHFIPLYEVVNEHYALYFPLVQ